MPDVATFVGLLLAIALLSNLAGRRGIPPQPLLVIAGLGAGFLPFLPDVKVDPEAVFAVFLPPILYLGAAEFAAEDIRQAARPVAFLAVGLVIATVVAVAVAAHLLIDLPWAPAFVLGAVVAPTDAVAATGIIRRLGAPGPLATILEGEALVNDGTALVAFELAVAAVGVGTFSLSSAVGHFILVSAGGIAVGAAIAWAAVKSRAWADESRVQITIVLATAFGSFIVADLIGVSGILAVVAAGLVAGRLPDTGETPQARLRTRSFMETLAFLAESSLYVLIGLRFHEVVDGYAGTSASELIVESLVIIGVVFACRALWMLIVPYLWRGVFRRFSFPRPLVMRERIVLSAAGMRGAVSVAAALSIPLMVSGQPFPHRGEILILAYATVLVTMLGPTFALPSLLRALGLEEGEAERRRELEARLRLAHSALERAEQLAHEGKFSEPALQRAREIYEMRISRAEGHADPEQDTDTHIAHEYREARKLMLEAEREALAKLASKRAIGGEALRTFERELDLEETRLETT